jgi:serine/threonine-protein kinase HipA
MRLAQAVGLQVPTVSLLHIPNAIYMIERFDRETADGGLRRKHQVDLCQLMNKWVGYKYESHGGVSTSDLFDSVPNLAQPAIERGKILKWIIFNFIIGNSDAHGKNISYAVNKGSIITLAPFYDLLCVTTYLPNSNMAMAIGGESRYGWVEQTQWQALADEASVKPALVFSYIKTLTGKINKVLKNVIELTDFTADEVAFINDGIIPVINKHLKYLELD